MSATILLRFLRRIFTDLPPGFRRRAAADWPPLSYQASQFGTGNSTGQVLYSYGQYLDMLIATSAGWRINHRQLMYMGPNIGNISVFTYT